MYLSLSELHLEFAVCLFRIKFLYILFTFIFRQFNASSHQLPHSHNSLLVFFVEQFHLLVKVGFEKAVLDDTVFFKLVFGVLFGDFSSDFTRIF